MMTASVNLLQRSKRGASIEVRYFTDEFVPSMSRLLSPSSRVGNHDCIRCLSRAPDSTTRHGDSAHEPPCFPHFPPRRWRLDVGSVLWLTYRKDFVPMRPYK